MGENEEKYSMIMNEVFKLKCRVSAALVAAGFLFHYSLFYLELQCNVEFM